MFICKCQHVYAKNSTGTYPAAVSSWCLLPITGRCSLIWEWQKTRWYSTRCVHSWCVCAITTKCLFFVLFFATTCNPLLIPTSADAAKKGQPRPQAQSNPPGWHEGFLVLFLLINEIYTTSQPMLLSLFICNFQVKPDPPSDAAFTGGLAGPKSFESNLQGLLEVGSGLWHHG